MIILARSLLFAFAAPQRALLESQYHQHGPLLPALSRPAEELLSQRGRDLSRTMQDLQLKRTAHYQAQSRGSFGYIQAYKQLCKCLQESFSPHPSIYRLVGWYNVTALHKSLLQRLIALREEPEPLIESIAWMKLPQGPYGFIEKDLRENRKIEGLYRNLKLTLSLEHLKQLNSIVLSPLVISKRTYMEHYALRNLQSLLGGEKASNSDIIWLFEAATSAMVDREDLTCKFQAFIHGVAALSSEDCESLMRTYSLRGRIDKPIYQTLIRPYLYKHKMRDTGSIIEAIKFAILSESEDYHLLRNLFELLNAANLTNSKQLYELHILTHYLRVRGKSAQLSSVLQQKLLDFCRHRSESKPTVNQLILDSEIIRNRKKNDKYVSPCLTVENHRLAELQPTRRSAFEEAFSSRLGNLPSEQMRLYEKPSFCCFELDFCLHDSQTQSLIDLEVQGLQYVFSSYRLTRWQQVRQEILEYYGIKVNRLKYHEFLEKPYLNCTDPPGKTGKFFTKK